MATLRKLPKVKIPSIPSTHPYGSPTKPSTKSLQYNPTPTPTPTPSPTPSLTPSPVQEVVPVKKGRKATVTEKAVTLPGTLQERAEDIEEVVKEVIKAAKKKSKKQPAAAMIAVEVEETHTSTAPPVVTADVIVEEIPVSKPKRGRKAKALPPAHIEEEEEEEVMVLTKRVSKAKALPPAHIEEEEEEEIIVPTKRATKPKETWQAQVVFPPPVAAASPGKRSPQRPLKPCPEGWERNEKTKRCRKVVTQAAAPSVAASQPVVVTAAPKRSNPYSRFVKAQYKILNALPEHKGKGVGQMGPVLKAEWEKVKSNPSEYAKYQ
jgi:hypothetical protein